MIRRRQLLSVPPSSLHSTAQTFSISPEFSGVLPYKSKIDVGIAKQVASVAITKNIWIIIQTVHLPSRFALSALRWRLLCELTVGVAGNSVPHHA